MLNRFKSFLRHIGETRQLSLFNANKSQHANKNKAAIKRLAIRKEVKSDQALHTLWCEVRAKYFPERLDIDEYTVHWSNRRQKRVLGSCSLQSKRIRIAKELRAEEFQQWIEPLLYHEMCHAVLGKEVQRRNGKRSWHGAEFKALEQKHPRMKEFDHWVKHGGWASAVRKERARSASKIRWSVSRNY